ncbi:MAG: hypothetical protein QG604_142 [Candidatus Dependentiae bacterium]|nr:hypothetical protein [Candidatus Dependentiae bacterium]
MVSLIMRTLCIIGTLSFTSLYGIDADSPIKTGRMTAMRLAAKHEAERKESPLSVSDLARIKEEELPEDSLYIGRLLIEASALVSSKPSEAATLIQHALFLRLEKYTGVTSPSKPRLLKTSCSAIDGLETMRLTDIEKILETLKGTNA